MRSMSRINLRVLPRLRPACASRGLHATPRTRIDETIRKGDLYEYSVVYTDRVYNLMSSPFQECMREISASLKTVYNAQTSVVIPGSGTYAMEAVARQFATGNKTLILRHGFFSYRWSQILEQGGISNDNVVLKAVATSADPLPQFKPLELDDIEQRILVGVFVDVLILLQQEKPKVVFAPHVETSTGIILPDEYLRRIGDAARRVGALFVLDGIASGTVWVDMEACNVDVFISAPQKGWSGPACCGLVMLNGRATETLKETQSSSFTLDLKQWVDVMAAYEGGAFKYYTTLPTDALMTFRDAMQETRAMGLDEARAAMLSLGTGVRAAAEVNPFTPSLDLPQAAGFKSVAAPGFAAPGVAVFYAPTPNMVPEFKARGMQIAAGVPWFLDEPQGLNTFRLGLFGLDKLKNVDVATKRVSEGMQDIAASLK